MDLQPSGHVDTYCRDNLPPAELMPDLVFDLPELHYPPRLNAATVLLDDMARGAGGTKTCLRTPDGEVWTYADLLAHANRIANLLTTEYGLVPGNRVMLRCPNNLAAFACWFAVVKAGGVIVATMPLLRATELTTIAEIGQIRLSLCDHRLLDDVQAADIPEMTVLTVGGGSADDIMVTSAGHPDTFENADTASDDVCMLAFTSGTTGVPKSAMHFHRDLVAVCDTFSKHLLNPTTDDVFIGTPPLAFVYGLGGILLFPMRVGASTVLVERATPSELAAIIEDTGATICFTAPTAYKAMLAAGDTARLGSLRCGVSAGEHLPGSTWRRFAEETGVKLVDGIGSTELLHIFLAAAGDDIRPGSTGLPVPGYSATILDELGNELPPGEVGRLAVKGPTGCRYLHDERQRTYVQDGWNVTGDTFSRDEDGYYWYHGRNDDMIVSAGYNIAGPEVEEAISSHPAVLESAVVGVADDQRGMIVKAFVVLRDGVESLPTQADRDACVRSIQDHTKATIAPYKYPRQVRFIDALPRTSTGKVQRFRLRSDEYADQ